MGGKPAKKLVGVGEAARSAASPGLPGRRPPGWACGGPRCHARRRSAACPAARTARRATQSAARVSGYMKFLTQRRGAAERAGTRLCEVRSADSIASRSRGSVPLCCTSPRGRDLPSTAPRRRRRGGDPAAELAMSAITERPSASTHPRHEPTRPATAAPDGRAGRGGGCAGRSSRRRGWIARAYFTTGPVNAASRIDIGWRGHDARAPTCSRRCCTGKVTLTLSGGRKTSRAPAGLLRGVLPQWRMGPGGEVEEQPGFAPEGAG